MSTELNSESSWKRARSYAQILSPIPSAVSLPIGALWRNHSENRESGSEAVSDTSYGALKRMEKAAKLKTPLYFAASALCPDRFSSVSEDDTPRALVDTLGPGLFASLLGLIYCHRRLNKICTPPDWSSTLSKEYVLNMELGYLVGSSFPKSSGADGVLVGGIRYAALGVFLLKNPDQFVRYRNLKKKRFDLAYEHEHWGCDHAQVAAYVIQELGLRRDVMETAAALRVTGEVPKNVSPDLQLWNCCAHFVEAAKESRPPPAAHLTHAALSEAERGQLKEKIDNLYQGASLFTWMLRGEKEAAGE